MARPLEPSIPRQRRDDRDVGRPMPPSAERSRPGAVPRPGVDAASDEDVVRPDDVSIDEVVDRLSRDISDAVNRAPVEERDELRSYAGEIVRDRATSRGAATRPPARASRPSSFVVAVWLAVAGAVLAFVIPPAGIVCFVLAGVAAVLAVLIGPGDSIDGRATPPDTPPAT